MKFFVAKVDIKKVRRDDHGAIVLSPLRFSYDASEVRLPVRLGLLNASGAQDLIVYLLHPDKRFEVANYPNVFIPTNLEVTDSVRQQFGAFYAELFDATLRRNNNKAVITEYAWQTTSCDPCPTPPLTPGDLFLLGDESAQPAGSDPAQRDFAYATPAPWVLTRLHTRYSPETLSDDLLFREAAPAYGGRADHTGLGPVEAQVASSSSGAGGNNFQGRYVIRHHGPAPTTGRALA